MADQEDTNGRTASTTWEFKRVKVKRRPPGPAGTVRSAARWFRYARWNPREPLTLKVKYRGGAECWYEIEARGSLGRFHGATSLHDVMQEIYGGHQTDRP